MQLASGGSLTYLFWRSAYLSMCFSTRNRILVLMDWTKVKVFGRDVSRLDAGFYHPLLNRAQASNISYFTESEYRFLVVLI